MEAGGQIEESGVGEQSESGYGGVYVQAGGEAYGHDQAYEFGAAEFHGS
jgi:hypothetical protein